MTELQALADSMIVLFGGEVVMRMGTDELAGADARDQLGAAMTGASA